MYKKGKERLKNNKLLVKNIYTNPILTKIKKLDLGKNKKIFII